jgi:hypothetical protein
MKPMILVLAALGLSALPATLADHGLEATLLFTMDDDANWVAIGRYDSGVHHEQWWQFTIFDIFPHIYQCEGFGSIESGFVANNCGGRLVIGGTGREVPFLTPPFADSANVTIQWNDVDGVADEVTVG